MKTFFFLTALLMVAVFSYCQRVSVINSTQEAKRFFLRNLLYPQDAIDNGYSGLVLVKFMVYADGQAKNVTVLSSQHPLLSQSTLDVIRRSSGNWANWTKDSMQVVLPVYYDMAASNSTMIGKSWKPLAEGGQQISNTLFMEPIPVISYSSDCPMLIVSPPVTIKEE